VTAMCDFFGVSRAAYYKWAKRSEEPDPDLGRMQLVEKAWLKSRKIYGYRRVTLYLQEQGHMINHKTVLRLMRKLHIRSVARKGKPYKKASEMKTHHLYSNILNRDFTAKEPNRKWVTDISYIPTQQGWVYLSTIKDLFDGFIVAHLVGRENNIALVTNTLKLAIQREKITEKVLLHSDQGFQYTSHPYFILASANNIQVSMSRRGNCWDNAPMESFFGHFKEEAWRQHPTPTFQQAQQIVDDYIDFYNFERIQLKTKQTPYQKRCLFN